MLLKFDTQIQNFTEINLLEYTEDLQKTVEHTFLSVQKSWQNQELVVVTSIMLVDNEKIQELNKKFRRFNRPTDVLSFPLLEREDFLSRYEGEELAELGDIVISVEAAMAQAKEFCHSLKRELCFLTAHSMLHLLGYDHMDAEDEKWMTDKQEELLSELGILRENER